MSDLKKMSLTVKNYNLKASGELNALYTEVRCEDDEGRSFHFKEVVMLSYLQRHGAIATDTPRIWYYKHLGKKSIVLVVCEKNNGKVEYDLDHMKLVAKSSVLKGIVFTVAAVPAGLIIATATYGLGLLFIPVGLYYGYRSMFKIPGMLRRKILVNDLASHGVIVR